LLPRGPGHGYPDREVEYQLGVARDERPHAIGFAYANDSYGWAYGDLAWFGHDGLGSDWYGQAMNRRELSLDVTVVYEGGRMVSEAGEMTAGDGSSDEIWQSIERARELDGSGRISSDSLSSPDGDELRVRTLQFARDEIGNLIERELWLDDSAVSAQTWERDHEGRVLRHTIEATETRLGAATEAWEGWFSGFSSGEIAGTEYSWRYEGTQLVERSGGPDGRTERWTYDGEGRPIESEGSFVSGDVAGSKTWTYDHEGRVIENCNSYSTETWTCSSTAFDEAGRVAYRQSWQSGDDPVVFELHEYSCVP